MSATENRLFYFVPINHSLFSISVSFAGWTVSKWTGPNTKRCTKGVKMTCDGRARTNIAKKQNLSLRCLMHASGALIVTSRTHRFTVVAVARVEIWRVVMGRTTFS